MLVLPHNELYGEMRIITAGQLIPPGFHVIAAVQTFERVSLSRSMPLANGGTHYGSDDGIGVAAVFVIAELKDTTIARINQGAHELSKIAAEALLAKEAALEALKKVETEARDTRELLVAERESHDNVKTAKKLVSAMNQKLETDLGKLRTFFGAKAVEEALSK